MPAVAYVGLVIACFLAVPLSISPFLNGYQAVFQEDLLPNPASFPGRLDEGEVIKPVADASDVNASLPNIVFILSDDHRYDFTSYAGHPFVQTPHLDQLASEGVVFNRAYVGTALCSPSRASFLTGVSPYQHGVWNNFTPWSEQNRTFFEYLKPLGYQTAFIGKWHMPGGSLPEITGLDHFISFTNFNGQGAYEWNPMIVNGQEVPSRTRYIATELTNYALEWMEEQSGPFVLYLSHKSVHASFDPDEPDVYKYKNEAVHIPKDAHLWSAHTRNQYVHLTTTALDRSITRYGEAIYSMDREIGRVLEYLRERGREDNTLVIYTSDNGYQWGEHQLTDKRWAYEESIRVPFLMRMPGRHGRGDQNHQIIANVDVAATLLDVAGVEKPDHMEGDSLMKIVSEPSSSWRKSFLYSYFFEPPYPTPTSFALVTQRYKLIETDWQGLELYDLKSDPDEQINLANAPEMAAVVTELNKELEESKRRAYQYADRP